MLLDERVLRLIALGASICANCQPCLQTNLIKALESGASEMEIAEAIWVGRQVRHGAATGMDQFAASTNQAIGLFDSLPDGGCSCS